MKAKYYLKHALLLVALFGFATTYAENEVKIVNFTELTTPVNGAEGLEVFPHLFESAAAWGDFNNDGYKDVLMFGIHLVPKFDEDGEPIMNVDDDGNPTNQANDWVKTTLLYKNNGDGTFDEVEHNFPPLHAGGIAWLDYNNDGNLDVFIAGETDEGFYSGLWENLGESENYEFDDAFPGVFAYFKTNGNNNSSRIVAAGDYNNDGWVDIVVQGWAGEEGRITYLYRNQQATGFAQVELPVNGEKPFVPMNGGTLAWGDYNNDGFLDLLACGYVQTDEKYRDYYDMSFIQDGRPSDDPENPNKDMTCGIGIIYINNGDGSFADPSDAPRLTRTFPYGDDGEALWGDYNNDGYLDFYAIGYAWWQGIGWDIGLYENKKDETIQRYHPNDVGLLGTQGTTTAWGDVNNDGYEDIIVGRAHPSAVFFNNFGDGTFSRLDFVIDVNGVQQTAGHEGGTMTLVDFDNDNDLDVFWTGYGADQLQNRLLRNDLDEEEGLPVNAAPSIPTNLVATPSGDGILFSWDASTDDLTPTAAINYNLVVKQVINGKTITKSVLPADLTTGRLKVNETLAPIATNSYYMTGLSGDFEWGVQAIDNAKNASAFAGLGTSIPTINPSSVSIANLDNAFRINADNSLVGTIDVYSVSGVNLYTKAGQINSTEVELTAGVYIVKVTSQEGTVAKKVVIK